MKRLLLLILAVVSLKIAFIITKFHFAAWDEAVFLAMGKWLYSGGSIGLWEQIRPIGLPATIGWLWKLGLPYIASADIVMLFFTVGCLVLTYLVGAKLYNKWIGVIAALILYVTPVFFKYSFWILTGIPALFFCLLALYMMLLKKYWVAGIFCAVAFMYRYPAGLMILALNIVIILTNKKYKQKLVQINSAFGFIILGFLFFNLLVYGSFLEPLLLASKHQSSVIGNANGLLGIMFYPKIILGNIILLFSVFGLHKKKSLNIIIPLGVFLIYFMAIPHKQERFAILFVPYLAILASAGIFRIKKIIPVFALILLIQPVYTDYQAYGAFLDVKPEFFDSYFGYFDRIDFQGSILTSDPVLAAHTDYQYYHYYDDPVTGNKLYDEHHNDVSAVIYTPASFPWNDTLSKQWITLLEYKIVNDASLVYYETWWGESKQIFLVK